MISQSVILSREWIKPEQIWDWLDKGVKIELGVEVKQRIQEGVDFLKKKLEEDEAFYGINTGFGSLCNTVIEKEQLKELQKNLLMSHACGVGKELPEEIVKIMLLNKALGLSKGYSGVRVELVERLLQFYNEEILPVVYEKGSLGASGDLAPLAHLSLPLIGMGLVKYKGEKIPAGEIYPTFGWEPLDLHPKEGLALLNGTQFMSSIGLYVLKQLQKWLVLADIAAAASLVAFDAKSSPFDAVIHRLRPFDGPYITAQNIRELLNHRKEFNDNKPYVQDPYSFRCIPQVHGAVKDVYAHVKRVVEIEINAVTDNPLIIPEENKILSGGNFHGEPLALSFDYLAMAISEAASISERRIYKLMSGQRGLPAYLSANPGINSGFMIVQYTAAALVNQSKQMCMPNSVDSIDSSNGQEDHVSMGANSALKLLTLIENLKQVVALEWMSALQAGDLRKVAWTGIIGQWHEEYRKNVPLLEKDDYMHPYMSYTLDFLDKKSISATENLLLKTT